MIRTICDRLRAGKRVRRLILYTWTNDGKEAENRFTSITFVGANRKHEIDLDLSPLEAMGVLDIRRAVVSIDTRDRTASVPMTIHIVITFCRGLVARATKPPTAAPMARPPVPVSEISKARACTPMPMIGPVYSPPRVKILRKIATTPANRQTPGRGCRRRRHTRHRIPARPMIVPRIGNLLR